MNILIDGIIFDKYPQGGIARVFHEILLRIAERNSGIKIYILCNEKSLPSLPVSDRIIPIYFHEWNFRPQRISLRLNAYRRKLFDHRVWNMNCQIFHSTYYTTNPCKNAKSVVTLHDLIDYEYPFIMPNGKGFMSRQFEVLSAAEHIICVSQSTADLAVTAFNIEREKLSIVHHDASSQYYSTSLREQVEFKRKYTGGKPFFLFVGQTASYKNLPTLLRAFGKIKSSTDHVLLLAGHAMKNIDSYYIDSAIQLQIEQRIVRLIHPDDSVLCQAYNAADAFVFPSLQEGFGIPLVEAMRCGAPVIASDIPVFREVCGEAALYFNPHLDQDLYEQLISVTDPAVKSNLIADGYERAKQFSWDDASKKIESIYYDLADSF